MSDPFLLDPPYGIRVKLGTPQRNVVAKTFHLVSQMLAHDNETTWRLFPPKFDDPLLEASEAMSNPHETQHDYVEKDLSQGADLISKELIGLDEADALIRAFNDARLVLAEAKSAQEVDPTVGEDLYQFMSYLLSSLLQALSPE
jgi:hypothetical protein